MTAKELKENLFLKTENGRITASDEVLKEADAFCEDYKWFLDNAKTEREAVKTSIAMAKKAGFTEFDPDKKYACGDKMYINNRGKAAAFIVMGKRPVIEGVRVTAAHIDSPRLDLKPNPLYEADELALFKTHYYGGIKKYQWTTVPLALHGVVVKGDGSVVDVNIGEDEGDPCFVVTDLLPHLAAEQAKRTLGEAVKGEDLNVLVGSHPFRDDSESELVKLNILKILNEKYGIVEKDFLSAELECVPAYKARDIGFDRSLIGAYGHDDRVCAYPALRAAIDIKEPEHTVIVVLADKEETGSEGNTGLNSAFLKYIFMDLGNMQGVDGYRVMRASKCLSADVNAAYDPTYPEVMEKRNASFINRGAVITKYTGARGKSSTNDASAEFVGFVRNLLDREGIAWQIGELGKVDAGGGGTVAMYIANLGLDVVDLGVPVLSMHAPFETVAKFDVYMTYLTVKAFSK
ncbi:MAG: aminopeptidase [Clostridia bacterium]|nr:aminopeptidase [Clostridia bacterium]MBR3593460.1 aminopeptidase [Clostridia bacterium]